MFDQISMMNLLWNNFNLKIRNSKWFWSKSKFKSQTNDYICSSGNHKSKNMYSIWIMNIQIQILIYKLKIKQNLELNWIATKITIISNSHHHHHHNFICSKCSTCERLTHTFKVTLNHSMNSLVWCDFVVMENSTDQMRMTQVQIKKVRKYILNY